MQYLIIDIGSNTVKASLYEYDGLNVKRKGFLTRQLGLIARIDNGILRPDAIEELCETINEYISKCDAQPYCFATESLRRVENLTEVTAEVRNRCGMDICMISSRDEAILSFNGFLVSSPHIESGIMADMGGGSTELLRFENKEVKELNSFRFGCLSLRKDYVKGRFPDREEVIAIRSRVEKELNGFEWVKGADRLCLVGGTASSVGKLAHELGYTDRRDIPTERFIALFDYLWDINDEKIALLEKHIPARVETILPGMCAYRKILETVNAGSVYISDGGIRDGFLYRVLRGQI